MLTNNLTFNFRTNQHPLFVLILVFLILFSCNKGETVPEPEPLPLINIGTKFTIATSAGLGGTITDSQNNVDSGQSVKITATANEHFQLKQWTSDCGNFDNDVTEITISASKNCVVRAEFEKINYTITATATDGGSVSEGNLSSSVTEYREQGQIATFTAVPDEGYDFSGWMVKEDTDCPTLEDSSNPKVTFIVEGNCHLEATFGKSLRTITKIPSEGGSIEILPSENIAFGDNVKISATADEHYRFKNWDGTCGEFNSEETTISFTVSGNCIIQAVFDPIEYNIIATAIGGGSVNDSSNLSAVFGEKVSFNATPEEGYEFKEWRTTDEGCPMLTGNKSKQVEIIVEGNCTLEAVFDKILTEPESDSTPDTTMDTSDTTSDTTTDTSETTSDTTTDTSDTTSDTTTDTSDTTSDTTTDTPDTNPDTTTDTSDTNPDTTTDTPIIYTITATASQGGTIQSPQTLSIAQGQSVSFTALPNDSYEFTLWNLNGEGCPDFFDNTYSIAQFQAMGECSLQANFEPIIFNISTTAGFGGEITPDQSIPKGETVSITASPKTHYRLKSWGGTCGSFPSTSQSISFTPTEDCQIDVVFEQNQYDIFATATTGGTVSPKGEATKVFGDQVSFSATSQEGYNFGSWKKLSSGCPELSDATNPVASFIVEGNCRLQATFLKIPRTITTSAGTGGTITQTQRVEHGDQVSITATPEQHFQFTSWTGNCGTFSNDKTTIQFTATNDCSLAASFEKIVYTLTATSGDGGTVAPTNEKKKQGETVSFVATPDANYVFSTWQLVGTGCPTASSQENPTKSFTVSGNCQLRAVFKKVQRVITTSAGTGGTISDNQSVEHGESVSISATPSEGYQIQSWSGNCGSFNKETNKATFTASKDCSIGVAFEKKSYTITTNAGIGGSITENQSVEHGDNVSISATPSEGYQIQSWSGSCGSFNKGTNTATFTASKDCAISVAFEKITYTITTNAGDGGSITENQSPEHGDSVSISATPSTGYHIQSWSGSCGSFNKGTNTATFTASKDCSISVAFEKKSYTITTNAGDGGSITENQSPEHGDSVSISATPSEGYQISGWTGTCVTTDRSTNTATFTATKDCSISVAFEKITYTITTSEGTGGTITEDQIVEYGESVSITATPDTGYQIKTWSGTCGTYAKSTNPVSITPTKDCSVSVEFEKLIYEISYSSGLLAQLRTSITPDSNGNILVEHGSSITFEYVQLTPSQIVKEWSGTCGSFNKDSEITFTATKNCNIHLEVEEFVPIEVAGNLVTVKDEAMKDDWVGKTVTIGNVAYIIVDKATLKERINNGDPVDKVVTTFVTDMSSLFLNKNNFNEDISSWDVSNVTNMEDMFKGASSFNQDIGSWDVSMVTKMDSMFSLTTSFNQDISGWDVSNVTSCASFSNGSNLMDDYKPTFTKCSD